MNKKLLIILLFFSIQSFSQETSKRELRKQKENKEFNVTVAIVNSGKFEFKANQTLPQQGPSISLTSNPNHLIIKGDSVDCSLPFFGRAYNISYNEQGGFHFSGIMKNLKKEVIAKKKKINLKFKLKGPSDSYQFYMTISGSNSATLTILSNNRASISYWGNIEAIEEK